MSRKGHRRSRPSGGSPGSNLAHKASASATPLLTALGDNRNSVGANKRDLELYWMLATRHPHVRTCITLIADAVASDGYEIVPRKGIAAKTLNVDNDSRVDDIVVFLEGGFVNSTERAMRRALTIDVLAFGLAYVRKQRLPDGTLTGLERYDPRTIKIKPNESRTGIDCYVVEKRTGSGLLTADSVEIVKPEDMILISGVGGDTITGLPSPLESLDLTLAIDFAARRFRKAFFDRGAFVGMIATTPSAGARKENVDAMLEQLKLQKTGVDNAFATLVAVGDWKFDRLSQTGENDVDFLKGTGLNREEVSGAYKVPVGMLVFAGGALGSAGKAEDQDFFETYAVLPVEEMLYEALTMHILRDEWDINDLELIPKRRNRVHLSRFTAAVQSVKMGFTGNEARRIVGATPIMDEKFEMDTPLFIGSPTTGLAEAEPLETPPAPVTPSSEQGGDQSEGGKPGDSADAATKNRKDKVAQKGAADFRPTRLEGRQTRR